MIPDIIVAVLLLGGAVFFFTSALGTLRFPDLYIRMHAATKGGAFGAVLMLLGVAMYFRDWWVGLEVLLVILFIFMTAPVAGHMISRAAYLLKTPMWEGTVLDEWKKDMETRKRE
ncbi:MAG: monovalent cation/H(+) antiporter subunit G [Bacteroidia bacterium]|nr:monovalent cation/H(+) antiporter subunit G [Bacteroidia bacterium]